MGAFAGAAIANLICHSGAVAGRLASRDYGAGATIGTIVGRWATRPIPRADQIFTAVCLNIFVLRTRSLSFSDALQGSAAMRPAIVLEPTLGAGSPSHFLSRLPSRTVS